MFEDILVHKLTNIYWYGFYYGFIYGFISLAVICLIFCLIKRAGRNEGYRNRVQDEFRIHEPRD